METKAGQRAGQRQVILDDGTHTGLASRFEEEISRESDRLKDSGSTDGGMIHEAGEGKVLVK